MAKKQFQLTTAVWNSSTEQLPVGSLVTFEDDEPTGIFIGRVQELVEAGNAIDVSTPKTAAEKAAEKAAKKAAAEAAKNEPPAPPAPPAA